MVTAAVLLAGCGGQSDLVLDLDRLEADGPDGTLEASALPNAHVGAVDDDLFVGVSTQEPPTGGGAQPVVVYLCDGEDIGVWLRGELADEEVVLEDGDARVTLSAAERGLTGTVALAGGEAAPFTASPATGNAGLYRAETTVDGDNYVAGWIVLPDGRQRGRGAGTGKASF